MNIKDIKKKHNIKLNPYSNGLFNEGIKRMRKSKDPMHAQVHVENVLDNLDLFLDNEKSLKKEDIDFNVLLPSIAWHDTWKATRPQTNHLVKYQYEQIWDGIGSARMFKEYIDKNKLDKPVNKKINHEIYKSIYFHSQIKDRLSRKKDDFYNNELSRETKILRDLDALDMWNMNRLNDAREKYCDKNFVFYDRKMFYIAKWLRESLAKRIMYFHFDWCRQEYKRRKKTLLKESAKILKANEE